MISSNNTQLNFYFFKENDFLNKKINLSQDDKNAFDTLSRQDQEVVLKWIHKQSYKNMLDEIFVYHSEDKQKIISSSIKDIAIKLLLADNNIPDYEFKTLLHKIKTNNVVNTQLIETSGTYNILDLFYNNKMNLNSYKCLYGIGKGIKRKGGGEHALGILSKNIDITIIGDISINNKKYDLKANGGRLTCINGPSHTHMINLIVSHIGNDNCNLLFKFKRNPNTKSLNLKDFFIGIKTLIKSSIISYDSCFKLLQEIFNQIFKTDNNTYGILVSESFLTSETYNIFLQDYIKFNFNWYKSITNFDGIIGINTSSKYKGNLNGVIGIAYTAEEFASLNKYIVNPCIIPSSAQGWEYYFQFWPKI